MAVSRFFSFDITDDDNDYIIIFKKNTFKEQLLNIIYILLNKNLQIYICIKNKNNLLPDIFIQIIRDDIKPLYYFKNKQLYLVYSKFVEDFDTFDLKFFNISFYFSCMDQILNDFNIELHNDMYFAHGSYCSIKIPWIDVFFILDDNNTTININIIDKKISIPDIKKYVSFYYGNYNKFNNYIIKASHCKDKKILFSINLNNTFYKTMVTDIFNYTNHYIDEIYHSINIESYLKIPLANMHHDFSTSEGKNICFPCLYKEVPLIKKPEYSKLYFDKESSSPKSSHANNTNPLQCVLSPKEPNTDRLLPTFLGNFNGKQYLKIYNHIPIIPLKYDKNLYNVSIINNIQEKQGLIKKIIINPINYITNSTPGKLVLPIFQKVVNPFISIYNYTLNFFI